MDKFNFVVIRKPYVEESEQISEILAHNARQGLVLKRDEDEIRNSIDTFLVADLHNEIIGVVSRYDYGQGLMEIRSLAVADLYKKYGIGSVLVKTMIRIIRRDGGRKIFALTYTPEFFRKNSFSEVPKESLPEKIWKDCRFCKDKDNCGETALVLKDSIT